MKPLVEIRLMLPTFCAALAPAMKPLVQKEIRLMLPSFCAALALAIVPVWLFPNDAAHSDIITGYAFMSGILALALSSFGREMGLKTLPFALAQPMERSSVWRIKMTILGVSACVVFGAWWLCSSFGGEFLRFALLFAAVLISGALWITLLVRQVLAAFWLSILIPWVLAGVAALLGAPDGVIFAIWGIYALAGFVFARRQFLHLQDTAWTGGIVSFDRARSRGAGQAALREPRPWAALFWKEIQMQQITLAGMACLLVLHICAVIMRKTGANTLGKNTLWALEIFGLLWFFAPLVAGSQSVAEERKLGTMAAHLCLPVSRRRQWFVKFLSSLCIGGLLSSILFWPVQRMLLGPDFGECLAVFTAIAIIGFYGSTLGNGILQGIGAAVLTTLCVWLCFYGAAESQIFSSGILLALAGIPVMVAALVRLSYRNFGNVSESPRLWRNNALAMGITVSVLICLTAGIYHRAWEPFTPLEPAHGSARISLKQPPAFRSSFVGLTALFEDGSLWVDRLAEGPESHMDRLDWGRRFLYPGAEGESPSISWTGEFRSLGAPAFAPGSNWVAAVANFRETVALRSDGSLWVSANPQDLLERRGLKATPLNPFGEDSDWQSLARRSEQRVLLLKRNGTLWEWGTNFLAGPSWSGLREYSPRRLGEDSDWARMLFVDGQGYGFLWKKDGRAWWLHAADWDYPFGNLHYRSLQKVIEPARDFEGTNSRWVSPRGIGKSVLVPFHGHTSGTALERLSSLDSVHWHSVANCPNGSGLAAIREDGTLWFWDLNQDRDLRASGHPGSAPVQIGNETDWADLAGSWQSLLARKTNGAIVKWGWKWVGGPAGTIRYLPLATMQAPPVQLGTHTDWVGIAEVDQRTVSLAADGSLWVWPPEQSSKDSSPFMAASKKPRRIENIFGARE